jgi:two-component system response regulator VicR
MVLIACDEANATTGNTGGNYSWETDIPGRPEIQVQANPAETRAHQRRRILIVEDQNDLAMCMELFLDGVGHEVAIAPTARRAYELLADRSFDLVLMDVDLPDGNGFDICRWMRQHTATASVPVVFCTGRDPGETSQRAAELNAGTLFKLFTMDEMLATVQKTIKANP